jgi:CheY-like chemotaxis protein
MSTTKGPPQKTITDLNNEVKKYLWAAFQNKKKIIKLAEITMTYLNKAKKIKMKEDAIRRHQEETRDLKDDQKEELKTRKLIFGLLKQLNRELQYLEVEWGKYVDIKKIMEAADNPWPRMKKLLIPVETPQEAAKAPAPKKATARKILIVEDEAIIIKSLSYFLLQADYQVSFALNAEDGLKKAQEEKPHLILLDIMMPGMNGFQFLDKIQRMDEIADIPVIILSSLSRESDILEGLGRGATDYITKPFSPQVLLSKINKILKPKNENLSNSSHH